MVVSELNNDVVLQLAQPSDDPVVTLIRTKVLNIAESIAQAENARRLRATINSAVKDYVPIMEVISGAVFAQQINEGRTAEELGKELHSGVWDTLQQDIEGSLSYSDKRIIVDVLKEDLAIADTLDRTPGDNAAGLCGALIDGYWPLKKMSLSVVVILIILEGVLRPSNEKVAHWLCLAMRDYLKEWRFALFANDPVLQDRLTTPGKLISIEEMERRVGV